MSRRDPICSENKIGMSRPLRIDIEGGWYHVTSRGHNREAIYRDTKDRAHFLDLLEQLSERHRIEIHAYVLMTNHYHLLVRSPEANLSRALQWLNVSYSIWWNRRHRRCGSVFQGRFKAALVEGGAWLLSLSQYIHYNPVAVKGLGLSKQGKALEGRGWATPTAEMVAMRLKGLREYRWSSYPAYAGYAKPPAWLNTKEVLARVKGGRRGYRKLTEGRLRGGAKESVVEGARWGIVLGSEAFAERIRAGLGIGRESAGRKNLRRRLEWSDYVKCMEGVKGERWDEFCGRYGDSGRDVVLWAARTKGGYGLKELAGYVDGVDYSAVYQAVRRLPLRMKRDKRLRTLVETYAKKIGELYNV